MENLLWLGVVRAMKNTCPDFTSKTLSVNLIGEACSRVLVSPRFELQAGRMFLVGTSPPGVSKKDWLAGLEQSLAWDRVEEYVVFDSTHDYFTRLKTWCRRKKSNKP